MKKLILSVLLVGWFFIITSDIPDFPGAKVVSRSGPFVTEVVCRNYKLEMMGLFKNFGAQAVFGICVEEQAA